MRRSFISPELWPPNSPDLNSVDYKFRGFMQVHVYKSPISDMDELKQRLIGVQEWSSALSVRLSKSGENVPNYVCLKCSPSAEGEHFKPKL